MRLGCLLRNPGIPDDGIRDDFSVLIIWVLRLLLQVWDQSSRWKSVMDCAELWGFAG